jgi:hypothetical protein
MRPDSSGALLEHDRQIAATIKPPPLFYIVDWLPPNFGAVGQYGMIFAREISQTGRDVHLIGLTTETSSTIRELCPGNCSFEIRRLNAKQYDKKGMIARLAWSIKTNYKLCLEVIRDPRSRNAEVLFTGSPPFMLFFAVFLKWLRHARLIYRITDFYPEVLIAAFGKRSIALMLLQRVTWFLRRRVDAFEVLGEDQRRLLLAGGIRSDLITLKRDVAPISFSTIALRFRPPKELEGRMLLLYSGNYGVVHEVDTVIEGLIQHHRVGCGRFGLWLNGSGSNVQAVATKLALAGVPFARTSPVPLEQLSSLLAAADAHLITLRPRFAGLVLPSKVYGCIDSGRPILFIGPKSSDVHLLCSEAKNAFYECIEPGDANGFARALDRLAALSSRTEVPPDGKVSMRLNVF